MAFKPADYHPSLPRPRNFNNLVNPLFEQEITGGPQIQPPVDLFETDKGYELYAYLPGVKKENLEVEAIGQTLYLRGKRYEKDEDARKVRHRVEASRGTIERSFDFPQKADLENVDAELKEGVLHIFVPKSEEVENRQKIEVQ